MARKQSFEFEEEPVQENEEEIKKANKQRLDLESQESEHEEDIEERKKRLTEKHLEDSEQKEDKKEESPKWKMSEGSSIAGLIASSIDNMLLGYFKAKTLTESEIKEVMAAGKYIDIKYELEKKVGVEIYFLGVNMSMFMKEGRSEAIGAKIKEQRKKRDVNESNDE